MNQAILIKSVQALVFRAPLAVPVQTSFGIMHSRPMVLVKLTDDSGCEGWGEIWCNFPSVGAEYRARLLEQVVAPLIEGVEFESVQAMFDQLTEALHVLTLQCGEPGPFNHVLAGVDLAVWDLLARRANQPLFRYLGGNDPSIRVYASGLNPSSPEAVVKRRAQEGYRDFKLKVGFGTARDVENLRAMRAVADKLPDNIDLMVDANQAWSLDEAIDNMRQMQAFDLVWVEEPLRADQPWATWQHLKQETNMPLAAGENVSGDSEFDKALSAGTLSVVQPDIAKWGGLSRGLSVAKRIQAAGLRFCPHYLGGGVGLLASAHLLAAAGGDGLMEIDSNDNPLRETLQGPLLSISEGRAQLEEKPGIGIEPDLAALEQYRVTY
ncbi:MAG: mandelate racemase/muconate lactonizing enzyme family protein [Burkholderiaceae bacterium]